MKRDMRVRTVPGMWGRVLCLVRARLGAQHPGAGLPIAAWMMQGMIAAVLCGLVRDTAPTFAYGIVALSIAGALVAVPLLGELSGLLVTDEAEAWVGALPVRPFELKLARLLHLLIELGLLSLGALVPAALVAPTQMDVGARLALVGLGLGQSLFLAAALLLVQATLRGRAQALLVLVQTLVLAGVVVGAAAGLRQVPQLIELSTQGSAALLAYPPAWFAAPLALDGLGEVWPWLAPGVLVASALVLALMPAPPAEAARTGQPILSLLLTPARALVERFWLRADERGPFQLVFEALPKEREFVLRTYPLIAVPLAFLVIGAQDEAAGGLLALLLFTPATYLPILLMHLPATDSAEARWLLDTAPVPASAIENGALKAVAVRFVLPLYLALGALCWGLAGWELALRLTPPAFLVALGVLRSSYRTCVDDTPLSTAPDDLRVELNLLSVLGAYAMVLTVLAMLAHIFLTSLAVSAMVTAFLVFLEVLKDRAWRREPNGSGDARAVGDG